MKTNLHINTLLCLCIAIVLSGACRSNKKQVKVPVETTQPTQPEMINNVEPEISPEKISLHDIDSIDLTQDIDNLSVQDLRLLHGAVYAKYGYLFMEADLRGYFEANTKWYSKLMWERWDNEDVAEIVLTDEETAFIEKLDARMAALKENDYIERNEYRLANTDNIVNLFQFKDISPEFMQKLADNNMVITPGKNMQLFHLYEENDYNQVPNFITTDIMLQAFHMYFSYTLKVLELKKFIPIMKALSFALYNESMQQTSSADKNMQEIAMYNAVFYAIPYYLLSEEKVEVPEKYKALFEKELQNIEQCQNASSEFLAYPAGFSYSQFKPRGHYTRKKELSAYFKAMQWLQLAPYCRNNTQHLKDAVFVALLLNSATTSDGEPLMQLYKSVFEPIVFLIGEPDNLSIMDIAVYLKDKNINNLTSVLQSDTLAAIDSLLQVISLTHNRIAPKIELSCKDKINFMPARYLVDNEIIQDLVDVNANANRAYPKGLDIFAAFGSQPAMNILLDTYKEHEQWEEYLPTMNKFRQRFENYNEWNMSVYNKWIESLLALQQADKSYPEFMQLPSWDTKNLNTSLASWADLKHDAILYGEQPMSAECGGGDEPPDPITVGYVEPNIQFWIKLRELISLTQKMLARNNLLIDELDNGIRSLNDNVKFLQTVSEKELKKEKLTEQEYNTIEYFGASIEYFTLSIIDPEYRLDSWSLVQGPDKSIAVVADIYTRNVNDCPKNGILHEAVGYANNIYVVVEIEGNLYLTKGAVFSYYEFVRQNERLTDEEWQKMLDTNKAPHIPLWMENIIIKTGEPKVDARIFYSSGC
jgi:hypothetical protein